MHARVHSCLFVFQCVHAWCADPRVCFCPYERVCSPVKFAHVFSNVLPVFRKGFVVSAENSLLSLFPHGESWSQPGLGTVTDTVPLQLIFHVPDVASSGWMADGLSSG